MIQRWVIVHSETKTVHSEGFATEKEAWAAQVQLARASNGSPYEWTAHPVSFEIN